MFKRRKCNRWWNISNTKGKNKQQQSNCNIKKKQKIRDNKRKRYCRELYFTPKKKINIIAETVNIRKRGIRKNGNISNTKGKIYNSNQSTIEKIEIRDNEKRNYTAGKKYIIADTVNIMKR